MTFYDKVSIPLGNLWRMKLRSFLTNSGVMIAIGAFVAMLSFGAGNQKYVTEQFNQLGLFSTMYVYPRTNGESSDTTKPSPLNDSVVTWLAGLPGVDLAYPYNAYEVTAATADTALKIQAQAVPHSATTTKMFTRLEAGRLFESDSAREAVVTTMFLREAGIDSAESIIGQQLVVSVQRIRLDSGLVHVLRGSSDLADRVFVKGWIDSVRRVEFPKRIVRNELNQAVVRFSDGIFNHPTTITDTLTIVGVLKTGEGQSRLEPILVPVATAGRFSSEGMSNDPTELYAALSGGGFFNEAGDPGYQTYPRVTLQLDPHLPFKPIKDSVEARGFRSFSYAEEFEEIQKFFIYFDMALALVGMIALVTASLGIVNTMVVSIMERRREIGVLKSLGAAEGDIRTLFLFESALIGLIGSLAGIALGWAVSRVSSAVARYFMAREGFDEIELFALPRWLVLLALGFGLVVSIAAGAYPEARAARVDAIEALRVE
ncbi:MAG: ABC transporter permease [Candidatus Zixiibacteriota bacterium]